MATVDVPQTFGAVLLGALFAAGLSGVVAVQVVVYSKLYPDDPARLKALVLFIWLLDMTHSGFVIGSIWGYLIGSYGDISIIDNLPWTVPISILLTACITLLVHCFFAYRIYMLSGRNIWLVSPILALSACRLAAACVSTSEMLRIGTLTGFKQHFRWVFTLGLSLSSAVDILITFLLFILLQTKRSESTSLNRVIDSVILYAFETGALTSAATVASMITWVTMNDSLIFLGIHFVIAKLYANSLLVTLNTRHQLRRNRGGSDNVMILGTRHIHGPDSTPRFVSGSISEPPQAVQISVEKSIQFTTDDDK